MLAELRRRSPYLLQGTAKTTSIGGGRQRNADALGSRPETAKVALAWLLDAVFSDNSQQDELSINKPARTGLRSSRGRRQDAGSRPTRTVQVVAAVSAGAARTNRI